MAWVDSTRIDRLLGNSTLRQRLFSVDGSYDANAFAQYEAAARSKIVSYLLYAGYADPGDTLSSGTTSEAFLADLCAMLMVRNAFAQAKGIAWPAGLREATDQTLADLTAIYEKKLPVPGLTPSTVNGYGGVDVSSVLETDEDARPQRFNRKSTKTW